MLKKCREQGIFNYELLFKKMKEYNLDIPIICEEISDSDAVEAFENIKRFMVI